MKLLIVEDDSRLMKRLVHIFESNKYITDGVCCVETAFEYILSSDYDGLILGMGSDGITLLKKLRKNHINIPVLFIDDKNDTDTIVETLDAGADDYMIKPFFMRELLARVRAMLRRKDNYADNILKFKSLVFNRSTYQLIHENKFQSLSGKEYHIVELLMQRPETIISAEHFMTHIWGWDTNVNTSVLWVHISNIRKKLVKIDASAEIKYVRNSGYILVDK